MGWGRNDASEYSGSSAETRPGHDLKLRSLDRHPSMNWNLP